MSGPAAASCSPNCTTCAPQLELVGVEIAARPDNLTPAVDWRDAVPTSLDDALVIANEWLDNIPVDVAEVDDDGVVRAVSVDPATGSETLGAPVDGRDAEWLDTWWPLDRSEPGLRAEIGWPRDDAWAQVVASVRSGVLLAADYFHVREDRPPFGTLAGYRDGHLVQPVPDGSCDVTSHVALDACAAAGIRAEVDDTLLTTQRPALRALGLSGQLPARDLAHQDPQAYAAELQQASSVAELLDVGGLGGLGWLVQCRERLVPDILAGLPRVGGD